MQNNHTAQRTRNRHKQHKKGKTKSPSPLITCGTEREQVEPLTGRAADAACGEQRISPLHRTTTPGLTQKNQTKHGYTTAAAATASKLQPKLRAGAARARSQLLFLEGEVARTTRNKSNSFGEKMETAPVMFKANQKTLEKLLCWCFGSISVECVSAGSSIDALQRAAPGWGRGGRAALFCRLQTRSTCCSIFIDNSHT